MTTWRTWANAMTFARTLGCIVFAMIGIATADKAMLVVAVAIYWVGDALDGMLARWLGQESRGGATFDIICDRICAVPVYMGWVAIEPSTAVPVAIWLVGFAGVDLVLSLAFLEWPVRGVGGFRFVDDRVYLWNYSPVAKAANSAVFLGLLVLAPTAIPAALFAAAAFAVKAWSLVLLARRREVADVREVRCLDRDGEPRVAA